MKTTTNTELTPRQEFAMSQLIQWGISERDARTLVEWHEFKNAHDIAQIEGGTKTSMTKAAREIRGL